MTKMNDTLLVGINWQDGTMKIDDVVFTKEQKEKVDTYLKLYSTKLLEEFVTQFKNVCNKEVWENRDEVDCEIHCGHLKPDELKIWTDQREVDVERLKWVIRNLDFELKVFLTNMSRQKRILQNDIFK